LLDDYLLGLIDEVFDEMDLSPIFEYYEREELGNSTYDPEMMTKILCILT